MLYFQHHKSITKVKGFCMGAFIVFNFDGTGNEPEDAWQNLDDNSRIEDESISNILKLHLMMGGNLFKAGNLYGESTCKNIDHSFYYQGVGTYGSRIRRILNQGLAIEKYDVASILKKAKQDFERCYQAGDIVLITGFSRGAALARRFVAIINNEFSAKTEQPFIFLCAFDTVASFGLPNLSTTKRPKFDVIFEHGCTLAPIVKQALHLVSLDEKRRAFQPTLMNHEPDRILELWFAGAHSDVGGGYFYDGLSDITLDFALNWLNQMNQKQGLPEIQFVQLNQQNINDACPNELKNKIGEDDIACKPDIMGVNHQQDRLAIFDWATLDDRVCCIIEDDEIIEDKAPIIHSSISEKIRNDANYRPKSLLNVSHRIYKEFELEGDIFNGLDSHTKNNT